MSAITVHRASEIPHHQGSHEIPGIRFRQARVALGITAWGMNVLDMEPNCDGYPEHSHAHDGQEELYLVLEGSVTLQAHGEDHALELGDIVNVPPEVTRKLITKGGREVSAGDRLHTRCGLPVERGSVDHISARSRSQHHRP
jgi:uncharacterized cupin superfamily protein